MVFLLIDSYTHILSDYHNVFLWQKFHLGVLVCVCVHVDEGLGEGGGGGGSCKVICLGK